MTEKTAIETGLGDLVQGYRNFRSTDYPAQKRLYEALAEQGQTPQTMVVSCCDSRVDPARIFSAGPGELFIVRNVANLVPPFEAGDAYHGSGAALEFAVTGLVVRNILVLGHAHCGGIKACLEGAEDATTGGHLVGPWMSILAAARDEILRDHAGESAAAQQRALELAGIVQSVENLQTFPFIARRVAAGELRLEGAYFAIATGELSLLDRTSGRFVTVD